MIAFAWYLLKVIICSGILYGYYVIALRNKVFHGWNRFYLLAAVVLSLGAPLVKINIQQDAADAKTQVVQLLRVVNSSDEIILAYSKNTENFQAKFIIFSSFIYVAISIILSALFIHTLLKIRRLKKDNSHTIVEGINFISTYAKGTPFSFFNTIFWNGHIDISTSTGRQIFKHEVAHVREKHSYDKVFMIIALVFFWGNPFYWLIRKELTMIHEFIADQKAVEERDTEAFAAMILQATYPRHQFTITNNLFYSPLKRRLIMLTKNKNPKISYLSRMLVLLFAALTFFAFTLKMKPGGSPAYLAAKKITVVIDAGHGGEDNGASKNGMYEKNVTLSIAKKISELNQNKNLTIILSREADENITPKQRVDLATSVNADLFISIHLGAETGKNTSSGVGIWIPGNDNPYVKASKLLASDINESFKNSYQLPIATNLKQREKGIWILKYNQCASVIVQPGFISNVNDLKYLLIGENLQKVAKNILNGIERYAQQNLVSLKKSVPRSR